MAERGLGSAVVTPARSMSAAFLRKPPAASPLALLAIRKGRRRVIRESTSGELQSGTPNSVAERTAVTAGYQSSVDVPSGSKQRLLALLWLCYDSGALLASVLLDASSVFCAIAALPQSTVLWP